MSDAIDDIDDEDDFETPDERRRRLVELFEWWDAFYEAATPVAQAAALLEFSNAFFHFRWNVEREWTRDTKAPDKP